jgi:hypothetical protein
MDVNGKWVGWGLGDSGPKVVAMKAFLKRKFSYAKVLDSTNLYDQTMVAVVTEMQTKYGIPATGIMDYATQLKCEFVRKPPVTILTAQGTGVDMWTGPPADTARAVVAANPKAAFWQPIGEYPANVFPMGPSVQQGVAEGQRLLTNVYPTGPIILIGYSQGAIVTSKLWRDVILNGPLAHRAKDVIASVTFGNPLRAPGVANGNVFAGWPLPNQVDGVVTGGISGTDDLRPEQTPAFWYDFVGIGGDGGASELYTNAPVGADPWTAEGPVGVLETQIYNIVQQATFADVLAIAGDVVKVFANPIGEIVTIVEALINGGLFVVAGPNADHNTYDIGPAVRYLNQVVAAHAAAA